jgi:hypothetical protein
MPTLNSWKLTIEIDHILRAQGADPAIIRARRPKIVDIAEQALQTAMPLLKPSVTYQKIGVDSLRHEKMTLAGGGVLSGSLIVKQLGAAEEIIALVCTIGPELEQYDKEISMTDPVLGLALDGVGSAACEVLANEACKYFEDEAVEKGLQITMPISPGMIDWSVAVGQPQIFALLGDNGTSVTLTDSALMLPRKSLSMVLGIGANVNSGGKPCDYCNMRETCKYNEHYPTA